MFIIEESDIFKKWLLSIRDKRALKLIAARLNRLTHGHFGDVKPVGRASVSCASIMVLDTGFKRLIGDISFLFQKSSCLFSSIIIIGISSRQYLIVFCLFLVLFCRFCVSSSG